MTPPAARLSAPPLPATLPDLQRRLLEWFAATARDLPWRHTRDPYRVLVAEMMLQQTQVERVRPKYAAFLAAFPTLSDLAAAPTAEVIRLWAGLGYNRRALNLQRAARAVRDTYGGQFPRDMAALQQLPGIGPYTAGALACFAFEQDVAFMDTNIRRVLQRLLLGPPEPAPAASQSVRDRSLLSTAEQMIPAGQGWAWNQALMELGALVCTAAAPTCWRCPLRDDCRAYAAWRQADEAAFAAPASNGAPYAAPARPTRRVAERRAEPFVGSNRYYRGRVLEHLRGLPPGERISLARLGPLLRDDYAPTLHDEWLRTLVAGLVRDGLVAQGGDEVGLPVT
jgi:A/G-specific adenine glycosylase